jgi:hypothetical protein
LRQFTLAPMLDDHLAVRAAANYRELRRRGSTVRKTVDVIIATFSWSTATPFSTTTAISTPSRITSACGWLDERVARSGTTPVEIPPKPRAGTGGTGLTTQSKKGWLGFSEWPR